MRLVLVGGGHGHLAVIHAIPELRRLGYDVTVIDPSPYLCYSGMLASVIGASVERSACMIPIARMTETQSASFVGAAVKRIDTEQRTLVLSDGSSLPWDILSCAVGSRTFCSLPAGYADRTKIIPLKPFSTATLDILDEIDGPARIAVIGGGASGVELAGNLRRRFENSASEERVDVTLFSAGRRLVSDLPDAAGDYAHSSLTASGVVVHLGMRVTSVENGYIFPDASAKPFGPYDLVIMATGFEVPPVFRESGLQVERDGSLVVAPTLKVVGQPIFAVGDCAAIGDYNLARVGVHALRQGRVLLDNLRKIAGGTALRSYQPAPKYLQIINPGDGTAVAVRGNWVGKGRFWMVLKERIDWSYVRTEGRSIVPSLAPPPRPGGRPRS